MKTLATEEMNPARKFSQRADAQSVADRITNAPRRGVAHAIFVGAWDSWIVEVHPRANPYGNPGVLREDGTIARYN